MPAMDTAGWVKTNGDYGYGCGCMVVDVDKATAHVTRLIFATPIPLAKCRGDNALPTP
jgi:hypothetical protein